MGQGFNELGAGGILLNSVNRHGSGLKMDMGLINSMKNAVGIPLLSTCAGASGDLEEVLRETGTAAALGAK